MLVVIRLMILAVAFIGIVIFTTPTTGHTHAQDVMGGEVCAAVAAVILMTFVHNLISD